MNKDDYQRLVQKAVNQAIIVPMRLQGWWKLEAVKRDGSKRLLADWFPDSKEKGSTGK